MFLYLGHISPLPSSLVCQMAWWPSSSRSSSPVIFLSPATAVLAPASPPHPSSAPFLQSLPAVTACALRRTFRIGSPLPRWGPCLLLFSLVDFRHEVNAHKTDWIEPNWLWKMCHKNDIDVQALSRTFVSLSFILNSFSHLSDKLFKPHKSQYWNRSTCVGFNVSFSGNSPFLAFSSPPFPSLPFWKQAHTVMPRQISNSRAQPIFML